MHTETVGSRELSTRNLVKHQIQMSLVSYIILFILATLPILFGAVQPWVWSFYTVCIFGAFIILLWIKSGIRNRLSGKQAVFYVGIFFAVTLFQLIPLPERLLDLLSSHQCEVLNVSRELINRPLTVHPLSYAPLASLAWWLFLLSLVLFFLILRSTLTDRRYLRTVIWLLFGLTSVEALYGILQALVPNMGVLWVDYITAYLGDARGTYINRNHFAGFMEMMIPLMLGFTLSREDWETKVGVKSFFASDRPQLQFLLCLGLVLMVLALLFSKSRAGITGFFVGLSTFILLIRSKREKMPLSVTMMFVGICILVFFYSLKIGVDPILERFLKLSTDASRLDFWRDSLAIIQAHPFGTGLNTFKLVFPVYNVSTTTEIVVTHLHNDYLHLLVETGWIGFFALVSGLAVFLIGSFRKVGNLGLKDDPLRFFLATGALSGMTSIVFHSLFDFNLHIPANCVYFVTLMAIVYTCAWLEPVKNPDLSGNRNLMNS